jgi:hypothetical protein
MKINGTIIKRGKKSRPADNPDATVKNSLLRGRNTEQGQTLKKDHVYGT